MIFRIPENCSIVGNENSELKGKKATTLSLFTHALIISKNDVQLLIKIKCNHTFQAS